MNTFLLTQILSILIFHSFFLSLLSNLLLSFICSRKLFGQRLEGAISFFTLILSCVVKITNNKTVVNLYKTLWRCDGGRKFYRKDFKILEIVPKIHQLHLISQSNRWKWQTPTIQQIIYDVLTFVLIDFCKDTWDSDLKCNQQQTLNVILYFFKRNSYFIKLNSIARTFFRPMF